MDGCCTWQIIRSVLDQNSEDQRDENSVTRDYLDMFQLA